MTSREGLSQLLARIARRDAAAFDALYLATSPKLFGIILRILRQREVAEDILQEVYVKIWDRASDFDPGISSPVTWMAAIARNRALDELRRKSTASLDDVPDLENIPADEEDVLARIEIAQDMARLKHCLEALEPEKRDMVLLAYHTGCTRDVLAERYNRPVGTIKTWLRRSLQQLKDCLGP